VITTNDAVRHVCQYEKISPHGRTNQPAPVHLPLSPPLHLCQPGPDREVEAFFSGRGVTESVQDADDRFITSSRLLSIYPRARSPHLHSIPNPTPAGSLPFKTRPSTCAAGLRVGSVYSPISPREDSSIDRFHSGNGAVLREERERVCVNSSHGRVPAHDLVPGT
jgi:hypothetical protein